jgi:hypothetical protein
MAICAWVLSKEQTAVKFEPLSKLNYSRNALDQ